MMKMIAMLSARLEGLLRILHALLYIATSFVSH